MFSVVRAVLCVDLEPDSRTPDPSAEAEWRGADRIIDDHRWLRDRMGNGAINWFLRFDHQVEHLHGDIRWPGDRFALALNALIDGGDEVGVHPHHWRWTGEGWVPDGTTSWVVENVERALDAYADVFGTGPRSFRYGDRFVSDEVTRRLIDDPDVVVDLTAEPGVRSCRGLVADEAALGITRHIDIALAHRYRPSTDAADIPSETSSLTMVPLTTAVEPDTGASIRSRCGDILTSSSRCSTCG
jgi:hypothetical protein